jgi:hypothetical protein
MDVIDSKTTNQLLLSLLAETAKATNELRCAQADVTKAQSRLQFSVAVLNQLIERTKD